METEYIELSELLLQLEYTTSLRYRLALLHENTNWKVHTLIIDNIANNGEKQESLYYDYETVCFLAGSVDCATVGQWLSQREGEIQLPGNTDSVRKFTLLPFVGKAIKQRFPNHASLDFRSLLWPVVRYEVTGSSSSVVTSPPTGFLLSDVSPFFPDYRTALLKLIYQVDQVDPNASLSPLVMVKLAHREAWLRHIAITPTAIQVAVDGEQVGGVHLVFSDSEHLYIEQQLSQPETIECPLPEGIPTQIHILLTRGNSWLDYYHRDARWPIYKKDQDNVRIETPPISRELAIEELIAQGEGPQIEFKRELSADRARLLNTVSAFANTNGGTILLGIDNGGNPYDLPGDMGRLADTITRTIHDNIIPMPPVDILQVQIHEQPVVIIVIGQTTTHACGVNAADPRYYVRRGASNFPARPEEITNLVLARHPAAYNPLARAGMSFSE
jgi:glutaredoxin-related protein